MILTYLVLWTSKELLFVLLHKKLLSHGLIAEVGHVEGVDDLQVRDPSIFLLICFEIVDNVLFGQRRLILANGLQEIVERPKGVGGCFEVFSHQL